MTRTFIGGFGPEINDIPGAYHTSTPTGFSLVTSPAPSHGTYFLKATGTSSATCDLLPSSHGNSFSATYRWHCLREFRLDGTLTAGQDVEFWRATTTGGGVTVVWLTWVYVSSSTYNVALKTTGSTLGTSSTAFSTGGSIAIRLESNGTNIKVWVNGALEITGTHATTFTTQPRAVNTTLAASQDMYWAGFYSSESSSESDRPGTDVEQYGLFTDGNGTLDQMASHAGPLSGDADEAYWDDWDAAGTADDATTYNAGATSGQTQYSTTATVTIASNIANLGVMLRAKNSANVGTKTVDNYFIIDSSGGGSAVEQRGSNVGSTSWLPYSGAITNKPGGGTWTQTDVDGLQIGMRSVSGNGATLQVTALAAELFSIDNDPPATATARSHSYVF